MELRGCFINLQGALIINWHLRKWLALFRLIK